MDNGGVLVALVPSNGGFRARVLDDAGHPAGPDLTLTPADVARWESTEAPRWVFDSTPQAHGRLLDARVKVRRAHDVRLTERILLGREGRFAEPVAAAAVHARATGAQVPDDEPDEPARPDQPTLFDPRPVAVDVDPLDALQAAVADQLQRIGDDGRLRLLVAAESASALTAVEMGRVGLPWRAQVHEALLVDALGPRPATAGVRPVRLAELAERITEAFGHPVNPDSVSDLREAFRRAGFSIESTRAWVLREIDHPAVPAVLAYKELSRLHSANGWAWLAEWVRDGRFRAEYLPGGVVSGRWATRGGGALQIPRAVRSAVMAEPGHRLVVADAAQLEPRVLAALSGDAALSAAATAGDLYEAVAGDGFGGDRAHAKVALLGAMYGATTGESGRLLSVLFDRYPRAMAVVEGAARAGERAESVRSVLGRASPPPGPWWREATQAGSLPEATEAEQRRARQVARDWGRFTRNFVIQASAADWAAVWLSGLRAALLDLPGAELVFFQHDEVIVHVPEAMADDAASMATATAAGARELVFPGSVVPTPVRATIVTSYADAK